ncbi:hypothetical protein BC629DRAFT_1598250 [Irpex lacteus]|nr:hypothetical protein BC629DRAFT_1598250 [Irpex lacteus]
MTLNSNASDLDKMDASLEYLEKSLEWLNSQDNLTRMPYGAHSLKVDHIIHRLESTLQDANLVNNCVAPINRLPPELLGAIFEQLRYTPYWMEKDLWATCNYPCVYPWPMVQAVCRYWRYTAINTPALWTHVCVSEKHQQKLTDSDHKENILRVSFERSGNLPLSVVIAEAHLTRNVDQRTTLWTPAFIEFLAYHAPRIRDLRWEGRTNSDILDIFTSESGGRSLEVFVLNDWFDEDLEEDEGPDESFNEWTTPRLHTLCLNATCQRPDWSGLPFRSLRRLVLEGCDFDVDALPGLHGALSQNPRLEDLIFINTFAEAIGPWPCMEDLSPIDMPCLKRIAVIWPRSRELNRYHDRNIAGELIETKLKLQAGYAKYYSPIVFPHSSRLFPFVDFQLLFRVDKLFIGSQDHLVGSDGHNAFCIRTDIAPFLMRYIPSWEDLAIIELWLCREPPVYYPDFEWSFVMEELTAVKKLVLKHGIADWLHRISAYLLFPALTELQLHINDELPVSRILYLLQKLGRPLQTLRVVLQTITVVPYRSFLALQASAGELESVATHVVFDDIAQCYPEMELPKICLEKSTIHPFWERWYVMELVDLPSASHIVP